LRSLSARAAAPRLIDFHPPRADLLADVLDGLSRPRKELSPKYFYDARGSRLFEDITRLPEYYLTRTEAGVMEDSLEAIARLVGPKAAVIEFGSGTGAKLRRLLKGLTRPAACAQVEISRDHLLAAARSLAAEFPDLEVAAVCADFTRPFELPRFRDARRRLVFFPGSTIGNFRPDEAVGLLGVMNRVAGEGGALLAGVDLVKDRRVLEAAYNDDAGVTAEFNLNLLRRINRELGADFELGAFRHQAVYDEAAGRIEMYLVSERGQTVHVDGRRFDFAEDERILTEYSHKYQPDGFAELAGQAGFRVERVWTDPKRHFSVQYLVRERAVESAWDG
jgi:L-histidine N-alpha-methyltransferase